MTKFRVRVVAPRLTDWVEVEALSHMDAMQEHHMRESSCPHYTYVNEFEPGRREQIHFSRMETEGVEGAFVVRTYSRGIYRRGGVKPPPRPEDTLAGLARALGWKDDPSELLEKWDGEGDWE